MRLILKISFASLGNIRYSSQKRITINRERTSTASRVLRLIGLLVTQTFDDPPGAPIDLLGLANLNGPSTTWAVGRPGVSFYELN